MKAGIILSLAPTPVMAHSEQLVAIIEWLGDLLLKAALLALGSEKVDSSPSSLNPKTVNMS